jgi:CheY-like chemotaxis protein
MSILVVDDDLRRMESVIDQLRDDGFEVEPVATIDEAYLRISAHPNGIECVILDIMMPPGNLLVDEDTESGLRSGVRFFDRIRLSHPNLPVLVLTNIDDQRAEELFAQKSHCKFYRKEELRPKEVTEQVRELLA